MDWVAYILLTILNLVLILDGLLVSLEQINPIYIFIETIIVKILILSFN